MQAVLEGLQHQEATVERDPPPGTLAVTLHAYQKRALAWMLYREEKAKGVRGGILAGGSASSQATAVFTEFHLHFHALVSAVGAPLQVPISCSTILCLAVCSC